VDLKGIEPKQEAAVTKISQYLVSGNIQDLSGDSVIVGKELASYLGLGLNSQLNIYSPRGEPRKLKVAGIFNSGMYEYDFKLMFVPLATAQDILGAKDKVTGVAVKLDNIYLADQVRGELARVLGPNFFIKTWMQLNENFFAALKLEKITMFIILTLIILVAAFNIASTLIVMVVEKTKDIGILKAIGATSKRVRKIFIYEGLMIGTAGTFLGASAGIFLAYLLKKYQFIKLPAIYSIERLPVSVVLWPDMVLIILAAMLITLVSTIYPASKAGKLKPVEALRYE
jgi:lipoprotein-releasing system permease protein